VKEAHSEEEAWERRILQKEKREDFGYVILMRRIEARA